LPFPLTPPPADSWPPHRRAFFVAATLIGGAVGLLAQSAAERANKRHLRAEVIPRLVDRLDAVTAERAALEARLAGGGWGAGGGGDGVPGRGQ